MGTVNDSEVVGCMHELTLLSSCDLFSRRVTTVRGKSACKNKIYNLTYYDPMNTLYQEIVSEVYIFRAK